jgi:hypothetical protein
MIKKSHKKFNLKRKKLKILIISSKKMIKF